MNILCVGGGTLGSVSPLLAVAEDARDRKAGHDVRFWGTMSGPERAVVESAGFAFAPVYCGKMRRYFSWENFVAPFLTLIGLGQSWRRLGQWRPDVVLAAGSFAAVPVVWAAWLRRVPVVVHHQDVAVGLANRLMFPFARVVTTVFGGRSKLPRRAVVTGNPVRQPFRTPLSEEERAATRQLLGLEPDLPVVVIVGGSSGASSLNNLTICSLPMLRDFCQVLHVTGAGKDMLLGQHSGYHAVPFIAEADAMAEALSVATVVVSRAGMGSLSELSALGATAVLVPLPGHQQLNAAWVANAGGASVVDQSTATCESFAATVRAALDAAAAGSAAPERLASVLPTVSGADYFERVLQLLR